MNGLKQIVYGVTDFARMRTELMTVAQGKFEKES